MGTQIYDTYRFDFLYRLCISFTFRLIFCLIYLYHHSTRCISGIIYSYIRLDDHNTPLSALCFFASPGSEHRCRLWMVYDIPFALLGVRLTSSAVHNRFMTAATCVHYCAAARAVHFRVSFSFSPRTLAFSCSVEQMRLQVRTANSTVSTWDLPFWHSRTDHHTAAGMKARDQDATGEETAHRTLPPAGQQARE